jgi:hypothetical protein
MIDYDLQLLMPDTIILELPDSRSAYSRVVYGDPVEYQARIEQVNTMIRDQDGFERVSNTTIYLSTSVRIPLLSRITLPDGRQPSILSVESIQDEDGSYATKVNT